MTTDILVDSKMPQEERDALATLGRSFSVEGAPCSLQVSASGTLFVAEVYHASEFFAAIAGKTLIDQCVKMLAVSPWAYVLLRFPLLSRGGKLVIHVQGRWQRTHMAYSAIWGALLSIQDMGVSVYSGTSVYEMVRLLADRDRSANIRVDARKTPSLWGGQSGMLATLPGIGPAKADAILGAVPNIAAALQALTNFGDEYTLPGVGDATKKKIIKYLGGPVVAAPGSGDKS